MGTEIYNPVMIETEIRKCAERISKGVKVRADAYNDFLAADHAFDIAVATAYLAADGTVEAKKHRVTLATIEARKERDKADAAYRYADSQWRSLENTLRALQSVGASVRATYAVAGRGEQ